MSERLSINEGSTVPIYRQVVNQIRQQICSGDLQAGDPLPSVRALAEELVINPNTIAKAYTELSRDGFVAGKAGRGYFVSEIRNILSQEERTRRLDEAARSFVADTAYLDFDTQTILKKIQEELQQWESKP